MAAFIHPSANVEDGAEIGDGTRVWHQWHIRSGAVIGEGCNLGKNVFVDAGVRIGNGVKIQNNVSVYQGVTIEDLVFVGPSVVFTNDRYPRAFSTDWEIVPTLVRRGASIGANATLVCGIEVGEYNPRDVKQAVAGYGAADKAQMQGMVRAILNLAEIPRPDDAADALAVAICHLHSARLKSLTGQDGSA